MSTESILKDYHIKDEEAFMRLLKVLEAETIVDPNKPRIEESPLARGRELLKSFSFRGLESDAIEGDEPELDECPLDRVKNY